MLVNGRFDTVPSREVALPSKGRLAEQSEATRAALLSAARDVFAGHGFAATTTEEIVRRADVTRGALYHHFSGKEELFAAVYEQLEAELAERSVRAAMGGTEPLDRLRGGIDAYLDACLDPAVQRIVLLDGLSVLGWEQWHALGSKYSFLVLKLGLEAAMASGAIAERESEPLTHLVQGALIQAGMVLARSEDPERARPQIGAEIHHLLAGLAGRSD
jgi:AcrR family transcriptional regulator